MVSREGGGEDTRGQDLWTPRKESGSSQSFDLWTSHCPTSQHRTWEGGRQEREGGRNGGRKEGGEGVREGMKECSKQKKDERKVEREEGRKWGRKEGQFQTMVLEWRSDEEEVIMKWRLPQQPTVTGCWPRLSWAHPSPEVPWCTHTSCPLTRQVVGAEGRLSWWLLAASWRHHRGHQAWKQRQSHQQVYLTEQPPHPRAQCFTQRNMKYD